MQNTKRLVRTGSRRKPLSLPLSLSLLLLLLVVFCRSSLSISSSEFSPSSPTTSITSSSSSNTLQQRGQGQQQEQERVLEDAEASTNSSNSAETSPPATGTSISTSSNGNSNSNSTTPLSRLHLPPSVDIEACRKHLLVVDVDRNSLLSELEYVKFVHEIVTHDYNHTLANLPEDLKELWGNRLDSLPAGVQLNYDNLNQGGAIPVVGYKPDPITKPTLIQELFLIKVCVNTQVAIHQVLQQYDEQKATGATASTIDTDTSDLFNSLPEVQVVTVYSSFSLSNNLGITSDNLQFDSSNFKGITTAYQALVTQVVSQRTGTELINPHLLQVATSSTNTRSTFSTGREVTRRQRQRLLTTAVDPQLPQLNRIDDVPCPGASTTDTTSSNSTTEEWCQIVYGQFMLYVISEQTMEQVYDEYSQAVQNATADGQLQALLEQVDPTSELTVTGAGPTVLPPPDTIAPTLGTRPPSTSAPHNITVPEETLVVEDNSSDNLGMIFAIAGVLMMVNCCIIGFSVYTCVKNRNNPDIPAYDDDDVPMEGMNDEYYNNMHKNMKKSKSLRNKGSSRRMNGPGGDFSESQSNPPTLEEIEEANSMPAPSPAPAPLPMSSDAQERERILAGTGDSAASFYTSSPSEAPTKEEIEASLQQFTIVEEENEEESIQAPAPAGSANAHVGYEDEEKLPVNAGELA